MCHRLLVTDYSLEGYLQGHPSVFGHLNGTLFHPVHYNGAPEDIVKLFVHLQGDVMDTLCYFTPYKGPLEGHIFIFGD